MTNRAILFSLDGNRFCGVSFTLKLNDLISLIDASNLKLAVPDKFEYANWVNYYYLGPEQYKNFPLLGRVSAVTNYHGMIKPTEPVYPFYLGVWERILIKGADINPKTGLKQNTTLQYVSPTLRQVDVIKSDIEWRILSGGDLIDTTESTEPSSIYGLIARHMHTEIAKVIPYPESLI